MAGLADKSLGSSDPAAIDSSSSSDSDEFSDEFDGFSDLEPDHDKNTIIPLDPPPADHIFDSFEECWAFLLAWSLPCGYGIRKGRTKLNKDSTGLRKVWIQYDKAEKPKPTKRTRDSGSKGVSCPFAGKGVLKDGYWQFYLTYSTHNNHGPSLHGYSHPCHRKLTKAMLAHITTQSAVGIAP
jgi:hypothetical protein